MNKKLFNFIGKFSFLVALTCLPYVASAAQAPNPRATGVSSAATASGATSRNDAADVRKVTAPVNTDQVSRSATRRPTSTTTARTAAAQTTQGVVSSRSAARQAVSSVSRPDASVSTARSGTSPITSSARSATTGVSSARSAVSNVSRANTSRATAVFDDVSKLGGGYATCRDAYNTCMDQFCAKANDTYRRCYCSTKFTEFRDTEAALDEAKTLLMRFEDNSLNAVDKTAAEVNAMYSATIGEKAIRTDTSAAQNTLSEIADLLSGKKKATTTGTSLGILSLDFSSDIGDIWGDNSTNIFGTNSGADLSKMEGQELYNAAHKQCTEMIQSSCDSSSVFTMAKSSYSILITQDCNAYEKKVNTQKEAVSKTVREAEKILREARLEEYRAHNSADVNECVTAVKKALTGENACGANYKKCLDYTGLYIDVNTGEPIYSPQLFKLSSILNLNNANGNVIQSNPKYNQFMDSKKMYAETALDSCRGKADTVWEEFKRSALIEIAQAQDAKIEEVKNSCVSTMAECYDTQSGALASFDTTTAQASGALNAYAARQMCADKVAACAALYAGPNDVACTFDTNGKLMNSQCGLTALLAFVSTVDTVKVAEGCQVALTNYANELCTPTTGDQGYPYACRLRTRAELAEMFQGRADLYCKDPSGTSGLDDSFIKEAIDLTLEDIERNIDYVLDVACDEVFGIWLSEPTDARGEKKETAFYSNVYGKAAPADSEGDSSERGYCVQNTVRYQCLAQDESTGGNGYAVFNATTNTCTFKDEWYQIKCETIGGYYDGGLCYVE